MSYWVFVLMGLHLGLHIPVMLSGLKLTGRKKNIVTIPMPIASFLEEYDFAGKRIIPFCSHGGG